MSDPFLLLWLEAPLQSWGFDSKFDRRSSLNFPTRSGILGLLCCALGAGGEQKELLARFAHYQQTVVSYLPQAGSGRENKARQEPMLMDFHMVGGGYHEEDRWQNLMKLKTNLGKKPVGGGGKITFREYLQDQAFAVVLQVPADLKAQLEEKLQYPVWDLYLGRKHCVPTDFVYRCFFQTHEQALEKAQEIAEEKSRVEAFRVLDGKADGQGEEMTLNDVPLRFGPHKLYRDRQVTILR